MPNENMFVYTCIEDWCATILQNQYIQGQSNRIHSCKLFNSLDISIKVFMSAMLFCQTFQLLPSTLQTKKYYCIAVLLVNLPLLWWIFFELTFEVQRLLRNIAHCRIRNSVFQAFSYGLWFELYSKLLFRSEIIPSDCFFFIGKKTKLTFFMWCKHVPFPCTFILTVYMWYAAESLLCACECCRVRKHRNSLWMCSLIIAASFLGLSIHVAFYFHPFYCCRCDSFFFTV